MPAGGSRAVIQRKGAHWQQHLAQKVVTAEHVTVPDGHPESAAPELRERCWELWGGEGGGFRYCPDGRGETPGGARYCPGTRSDTHLLSG